MRFLSIILLLSLPCTISIKAMECGTEKTEQSASAEIVPLTENDYRFKISILHSFIRNKITVADDIKGTVSFPDFENPSIINTAPLSDIKYEIKLGDSVKNLFVFPYFAYCVAIKTNICHKPLTLEQKKKLITDYFTHANNETKYHISLEELGIWLRGYDVESRTTLPDIEKEIYKTNRLKLKAAVENGDIYALKKLENTLINPYNLATFPVSINFLIQTIHKQLEPEVSKPETPSTTEDYEKIKRFVHESAQAKRDQQCLIS